MEDYTKKEAGGKRIDQPVDRESFKMREFWTVLGLVICVYQTACETTPLPVGDKASPTITTISHESEWKANQDGKVNGSTYSDGREYVGQWVKGVRNGNY